ncbi:MAG: dihydroorotate dehydrogenase [Coriobacteriia bacterium]|nr:dihydroorotate dehydrogenase [Coriobacteriia bacterium]
MKLEVNLAGLSLKNPFTVASGTFASGKEYADLWSNLDKRDRPLCHASLSLLGAITTKGVSLNPWPGNEGIRITETASGMLNSIGLQNPGVEEFCAKDLPWLATQDVPVIVNVAGHSTEEYVAVIQRLEQERTVSAFEINISCPNVDCGGISFGVDPKAASQVTQACRSATKRPLIIKLTPNVTDITTIARACEAAGADALSLINTVAGMAIDAKSRKPVFSRKVAGLSGPAIKPIALYAVHRVFNAVDIPLIGMGGIASAEDAVEFLLAGATAIALGSHNFTDPLAVPHILKDFMHWCEQEGIKDVSELIGGLQ